MVLDLVRKYLGKNESIPLPDKTESTGNYHDVDSVTANIGDTIDYKVTGSIARYIETSDGAQAVLNLVFKDTLSDGLTGVTGSLAIKVTDPETNTETTLVKGTDYTYTQSGKDLNITLTTATLGEDNVPTFNYKAGTKYTITYSATVNANAVVGNPETEAGRNKNTIDLKYNNNVEVGTDTTYVYTYELGLTKVNSSGQTLTGAKFKLYDSKTGGNEIKVVLARTTESGTKIYRHANNSETPVTEMEVGTNGALAIEGLNNGTYYFEETAAPEGYNALTERTTGVKIENANNSISVTNTTGSVLPSTGGIGTTIFYVIGGVLVAGAIVLLVVRRRRNA